MARSARELFEEAMRLDPQERATLMRLLIDTLDAESEETIQQALTALWAGRAVLVIAHRRDVYE